MSRAVLIVCTIVGGLLALSVPWIVSYVMRDVTDITKVWWGFPTVVTAFVGFITFTALAVFSGMAIEERS